MTGWLLDTLLATSGLIVLVLLVREPVRNIFGARVAYGLWLIPAARLLMPALTETIERPVATGMSPRLIGPQYVAEPLLLKGVARPEQSLIDALGGWPAVLLALWLSVALGLFAVRMVAFRRERAAILASATEVGRIGSIRLVASPLISGPLAFGILDRVIAVPADFERLYAEREQRLALAHELSHHRSGDLVVNFAAFVLLCVQWFNPLAWIAHAAFRFDQEAACDARVLEKARAEDRFEYGRAIAKAASGRTLLFASALDRDTMLHRRLKSMLSNPTPSRRLTGRLMILATVAIALPLTATRAIEYVDAPAPSSVTAASASAVTAQALPAVQAASQPDPLAAEQPRAEEDERIMMIDGEEKDWDDLTPAEKAEVRAAIAKASEAISKIDGEEMQRTIRDAMAKVDIDQAGLHRDLAEAMAEATPEIDAEAAALRRSGKDPEQIKALIRTSLTAVAAIDMESITRSALASVDFAQIEAAMAEAEEELEKAKADIERAEADDPAN